MKTCQAPTCNNSLAGKRANVKYCSTKCKADAQRIRDGKKALGATDQLQSYGGQPLAPSAMIGGGNDYLYQKRIEELLADNRELKNELKEAIKQGEALKDKLREKDIELIRGEKPEGLGKIDMDTIGQLAPHIPVIMESLKGILGGNGGGQMTGLPGGSPTVQRTLTELAAYLTPLPSDQQEAFYEVLNYMAVPAGEQKANELLTKYNQTYGRANN